MKAGVVLFLGLFVLLAGCGTVGTRRGGRSKSKNDPTILGVRASYLNTKNTRDAYGGEVTLSLKDPKSSHAGDIGYGAYQMVYRDHGEISDGDSRMTVLILTYRYYLSDNAPKGFYLGGGIGSYKVSYKIDDDAREEIQSGGGRHNRPCDFYRERLGDANCPHIEVGLDIPLGKSTELCIGLRKVDMTLQVKSFFDDVLEKDKAKINPAVWFVSLSFHF